MYIFEVSLFGIQIAPTWYGLMYAGGFFICYSYMKKYSPVKEKDMENLLLYVFLGVIIGGRLGYVLFYNLSYFLAHPLEILALWNGGMSFHGGAIGVILALSIFVRRYRYPIYAVSDYLVSILPVALGLGRIGNYINKELLGYTGYTGPFAIMKNGVSYFPSPLFQAFLEGIILLIIVQVCFFFQKKYGKPGYTSAMFLIGYGLLRILAEIFRLPDSNIGYLFGTTWMTLGMIYSIPMILGGLALYLHAKRSHT